MSIGNVIFTKIEDHSYLLQTSYFHGNRNTASMNKFLFRNIADGYKIKNPF